MSASQSVARFRVRGKMIEPFGPGTTNSTVDFNNLTISNNSAGLYGNGVYMRDAAELNVLNTIIWGNGSPQIYFRSERTEVELNISYSLVENGEDGIQINDNGDLNWGSGNLDEEPYFCSSGIGNYYIRENSPCVDGGSNGGLIGCFESGCGPINVGPIWYVDNNGDNNSDGSISESLRMYDRVRRWRLRFYQLNSRMLTPVFQSHSK